jgi:hypothetical protein
VSRPPIDPALCWARHHMPMPVCLPAAAGVGGGGGSGSNFTDYIEFQHSDDEAGDEADELLHANGVGSSSSHAAGAASGAGEEWTWGRLLRDTLKVRAQQDRLSACLTNSSSSSSSTWRMTMHRQQAKPLSRWPEHTQTPPAVCCVTPTCSLGLMQRVLVSTTHSQQKVRLQGPTQHSTAQHAIPVHQAACKTAARAGWGCGKSQAAL